jgi:pimeloyl-ACP methyl ester carboxylesterase
MFRELIPELAVAFHVVAPDLPGFGFSQTPTPDGYSNTFANLARTVEAFTEALSLRRYALYVFDYGAPVGFRLALAHPERVTAIVTQNGNAYLDGLSGAWDPIQAYWQEPTPERREALRALLTLETTRWQYTYGVNDEAQVAPESYTLDAALLARPGNDEIQLDLFQDYKSNVALYPLFQAYLREHKPPVLAVWGKNDPFFLPAGAEAYRRDVPEAELHFFDTGHFALETHGPQIARTMREFLARVLPRAQ